MSSATRAASSNSFGCARRNGATKSSSAQLPADGLGDLPAAVAGGHAEQSRRRVDDLVAAIAPVIHALGADDHLRVGLELAVRRERHPVFVERDLAVVACSCSVSSRGPLRSPGRVRCPSYPAGAPVAKRKSYTRPLARGGPVRGRRPNLGRGRRRIFAFIAAPSRATLGRRDAPDRGLVRRESELARSLSRGPDGQCSNKGRTK